MVVYCTCSRFFGWHFGSQDCRSSWLRAQMIKESKLARVRMAHLLSSISFPGRSMTLPSNRFRRVHGKKIVVGSGQQAGDRSLSRRPCAELRGLCTRANPAIRKRNTRLTGCLFVSTQYRAALVADDETSHHFIRVLGVIGADPVRFVPPDRSIPDVFRCAVSF